MKRSSRRAVVPGKPGLAALERRSVVVPPWGLDDRFAANLFVPIRLALALLVIFSHSFPLARGPADTTEPLLRLTGQVTLGEVAVNLFLVISGFLVARSREKTPSVRAFLAKRILRVYPAFLVLTAVQAFVLAPLVCQPGFVRYTGRQVSLIAFEAVDLVGYGFPYGGLPTPFPDNPFPRAMNGSLWTIRYEFLCYLAIAFGAVLFRRGWSLAVGFGFVLTVYGTGWLPPWHRLLTGALGDVRPWPRLLACFLAGAFFYRCRRGIPHDGRLAALTVVLVLAAGAAEVGFRVALLVGGMYLLFWFAYHPQLQPRRGLRLGDFSYGTYLYGFPIQQALVMWTLPMGATGPYKLAALAAALSLVAGALSWYLVERPFLTLKPSSRPSLTASRPVAGC